MKRLIKGTEPPELSQARAKIRSTPDSGEEWYDLLTSEVREKIKEQCLREQGYLCAYTGLRIEMKTSHLEHMYPQSQCTKEEQIDYSNLVACFNGIHDKHPGFGAKQKDKWPDRDQRPLMVRPIDNDCETCFIYSASDGTVEAADNTARQQETIKHLRLSDEQRTPLVGWRREDLSELLDIDRVDDIKKRLAELKETKNGRYEPYVFPKQQFLEARLAKLEPKNYGNHS